MAKINWGAPEDKFPLMLFDDFDGKVVQFEYEAGDYGTQIHMRIEPADYEVSARDATLEEGTLDGRPGGWYGMGGSKETYQISDNGYEVEGPQPNKSTRAVKVILAFREAVKVKLRAGSIQAIEGVVAHFKAKEESTYNRETKESSTRFVLYPVGKAVGHSTYGDTSSDEATKEDSTTNRRRRRNTSEDGSEASEQLPEVEVGAESQDESPSESNNGELSLDDARGIIEEVVESGGENGISKRRFASVATQFEEKYSEELIAYASRRSTITAAIEAGVLEEEGNNLFIPQE